LAFSVCRGTGRQSATTDRLVTWHWPHMHRRTRGGRWWARTYTTHGCGKRGPWASKRHDGAAYVMPELADKVLNEKGKGLRAGFYVKADGAAVLLMSHYVTVAFISISCLMNPDCCLFSE